MPTTQGDLHDIDLWIQAATEAIGEGNAPAASAAIESAYSYADELTAYLTGLIKAVDAQRQQLGDIARQALRLATGQPVNTTYPTHPRPSTQPLPQFPTQLHHGLSIPTSPNYPNATPRSYTPPATPTPATDPGAKWQAQVVSADDPDDPDAAILQVQQPTGTIMLGDKPINVADLGNVKEDERPPKQD